MIRKPKPGLGIHELAMQLLWRGEVSSRMLSAAANAAIPIFQTMEQETSLGPDNESSIDFELMDRVGAGDHAAFRALVERHQNAVIGTVAKMLGSPTDAEDISQQVFLRIWRNAKRYRPDAKFTTYLFTITRNLVFNETRRRGRKKEVSSEEREENSQHQIADRPDRRPDAELLQAELRQAVDTAIAALPENVGRGAGDTAGGTPGLHRGEFIRTIGREPVQGNHDRLAELRLVDAEEEHQRLLGWQRQMLELIEVPYRVIDVAAGDLTVDTRTTRTDEVGDLFHALAAMQASRGARRHCIDHRAGFAAQAGGWAARAY